MKITPDIILTLVVSLNEGSINVDKEFNSDGLFSIMLLKLNRKNYILYSYSLGLIRLFNSKNAIVKEWKNSVSSSLYSSPPRNHRSEFWPPNQTPSNDLSTNISSTESRFQQFRDGPIIEAIRFDNVEMEEDLIENEVRVFATSNENGVEVDRIVSIPIRSNFITRVNEYISGSDNSENNSDSLERLTRIQNNMASRSRYREAIRRQYMINQGSSTDGGNLTRWFDNLGGPETSENSQRSSEEFVTPPDVENSSEDRETNEEWNEGINSFDVYEQNSNSHSPDKLIRVQNLNNQYLYSCSQRGKITIRDLINDDADNSHKVFYLNEEIVCIDIRKIRNTFYIAAASKVDLLIYKIRINTFVKKRLGSFNTSSFPSSSGTFKDWICSVNISRNLIICGTGFGYLIIYDLSTLRLVKCMRVSRCRINLQSFENFIIFNDSMSKIGILNLCTLEVNFNYLHNFGPIESIKFYWDGNIDNAIYSILSNSINELKFLKLFNNQKEILINLDGFKSSISSFCVVDDYGTFETLFGEVKTEEQQNERFKNKRDERDKDERDRDERNKLTDEGKDDLASSVTIPEIIVPDITDYLPDSTWLTKL